MRRRRGKVRWRHGGVIPAGRRGGNVPKSAHPSHLPRGGRLSRGMPEREGRALARWLAGCREVEGDRRLASVLLWTRKRQVANLPHEGRMGKGQPAASHALGERLLPGTAPEPLAFVRGSQRA